MDQHIGATWKMGREARARAYDLLSGHLAMANLEGFTSPLMPGKSYLQDPLLREAYAEVLVDFHDLLEEIQFHVMFGAMILTETEEALRDGRASKNEPPSGLTTITDFGMPVEASALLAPFERQVPPPCELFDTPYQHISGGRILSTWFAGQLFDSAIVRSIAALDRLAILLWLYAGRPVPTVRGKPHAPSFSGHWLKQMSSHYSCCTSSWPQLIGYADNPLLMFVKGFRDGFVHRKRMPSALHGETKTSYSASNRVSTGLNPRDHEALAVAFYAAVVREVATLIGKVMLEDAGLRQEVS